jgi:hypothetical protein
VPLPPLASPYSPPTPPPLPPPPPSQSYSPAPPALPPLTLPQLFACHRRAVAQVVGVRRTGRGTCGKRLPQRFSTACLKSDLFSRAHPPPPQVQLVNHFDHIIVAGGAPDTKLQNRESVFTPLQCTLTLPVLFYPLKRGSTICALPPTHPLSLRFLTRAACAGGSGSRCGPSPRAFSPISTVCRCARTQLCSPVQSAPRHVT